MERPQILVVEDDEAIAVLLKQVLELDNYRVTTVCNGLEALQFLESTAKSDGAPNLIISDLTMPVMDGVEFRKKQFKDPILTQIPFVLMTADTNFSVTDIGLTEFHLLKKPLSIDEVLNKVRLALQTKLK